MFVYTSVYTLVGLQDINNNIIIMIMNHCYKINIKYRLYMWREWPGDEADAYIRTQGTTIIYISHVGTSCHATYVSV